MNFDKIPIELKKLNIWCVWKYDEKGKIPYNPLTGNKAQSNNQNTFTGFDVAYNAFNTGAYSGLGIGIFHGIGAIDIDHCIIDKRMSDMATTIIQKMNSYTEISPSGNGIRIIFTVSNFVYNRDLFYIHNQKAKLEIYISGATNKFVTITGNRINEHSIADGTLPLQEVLNDYMLRPKKQNLSTDALKPTALDKNYLKRGLEKDKALKDYWNGNRPKKSESENDAGFMEKLLYWTNGNTDNAIAAFKSSPYSSQKDDKHLKKMERDDYLIRVAQYVMPDRTAIQDDQQWQKEHARQALLQPEKANMIHNKLEVISAPDLQKADLPPVKYLVEGILPEGTSILSAASKVGKSWFVLDLALKVAAGEKFLNKQTMQVGVLYIALEDRIKRLQDRMNKLLGEDLGPSLLYFATKAPNLENSLLECLDNHLAQHPETKLIIIDTFQKIRGQALTREQAYQQDYREMGMVKEFADKKEISVVFVHHNRKMSDKDDPFNMISGTTGIMGAADTIFVLTKESRKTNEATLHITGRDIDQSSTVMCFNKDTCQWKIVGDEKQILEETERFEYQYNPIVKTITALLKESPKKRWDGTASDFLEAIRKITQSVTELTPQSVGKALIKLSKSLYKYDRIIYKATSNGTAGKRHHFYYDRTIIEEDDESKVVF